MSLRYTYTLPADVIHFLSSLRARERDELLRVFSALGNDPFVKGERIQHDDCGRPMQVKRFGRWAVTFWLDHAACEVRIVEVSRLSL